jgi:hypothetical protein
VVQPSASYRCSANIVWLYDISSFRVDGAGAKD